MKESRIESAATIGLGRLRQHGSEHEYCTAMIMHNACEELNKGEYGERAVKALFDLWKELKLGEVTGESLSELCSVVERMHYKSEKQYEVKS